jgi:hypothetical protein
LQTKKIKNEIKKTFVDADWIFKEEGYIMGVAKDMIRKNMLALRDYV